MTFLMLKIKNPGEFKVNKSFLKSLFKGFRSEDGIETYLAEELDRYTSQFLFYLEDQKITGTLRSGMKSSEPFAQYISLFCHKNIAFLEFLNEKYTDEIIEHVKKDHQVKLTRVALQNKNVLNIIDFYKKINIKQVDFIDDEECSVSADVTNDLFEEGWPLKEVIQKHRVNIHFMSAEIPNVGLISFQRNGKVNINSLNGPTVEQLFKEISDNVGAL